MNIDTGKVTGSQSNDYLLYNEESMFHMTHRTSATSDKPPREVVFFETAAGGAVFSVGSTTWVVGALVGKKYKINVASDSKCATCLHRKGEMARVHGSLHTPAAQLDDYDDDASVKMENIERDQFAW